MLPDGSRCGRPCRFPVTITDNESRGIEIEEVAITSDPGTDGTYVTGDEITVAVSYSNQLRVGGDPLLALAVGEEGRLRAGDFREAEYVGIGNTSRTLTFSYTVSETDHDEDGLGLGGPPAGVWGGITPNGATIRSLSTAEEVLLGHPGLPSDPGHRINRNPEVQYRSVTSISSPVADANTYGAGESIVFGVPFDFPVVVDTSGGLPTFRIKFDGAEERFMNYVRGSGTTALVFEYVVQAGDMAQDIRFSGNALERDGGRIRHTTTGQDAIVSFLNTSYTGVYPQAVDGSLSLPSASLTGLALSDVSLSPAFAAETVRYIGVVGNNVGETTITAMAVAGAAVVIMPPDSDRVAAGHQMALGSGTQEITVAVSRPGSAPRTYTVVVTSSPFVNIVSNTPSVVFQNFTDEFSHTLTRVGSLAEALTVQIELSQGPDDHDYYENDRRRVVIPAGQATVDWVRDVFPLERFAIGEVIRSGTLTATVVEGVGYEPGADRVAQTDILIGLVTWYEMESYEVGEDDGMLFYKMIARTDDDPARLDMETTQRGDVTQSNSARWGVDYTVGGGTGIITMRASDFRWDGASYVAEYPRSVTILSNTRVDGDRNFHLVMEGVSGLQEAYGQYARANGERCVTNPQDFSSAESCAALVTIIDNDSPDASIESLVSNVEAMSDEVFFAGGQASPRVAQWFTTGSEPSGYIVSSVGVRFAGVSASAGETITFQVYETTPGGGLGPLVHTLESPTRLTADGLNNYAAPANAALSADTAYALAFTSTGNFSGDFLLAVTPSDAERAGSGDIGSGWSLADAYHLDGSPSPRGRSLQVNVKGFVRGVLAQGAPTITGTAKVGLTLVADTSGISDGDGLANVSYAYQWIRVDGGVETPIAGATGNTYALVAADAGKSLKVAVSFQDDRGYDEEAVSTATAPVEAEAMSLVSNFGRTPIGSRTLRQGFAGDMDELRQRFTTGSHANGYDLDSVRVQFSGIAASPGDTLTLHIYTVTPSGGLGGRVHTLISPEFPYQASLSTASPEVSTFLAPANAALATGTDYLLVLEFEPVVASASTYFQITRTTNTQESGETGWSIRDNYVGSGGLTDLPGAIHLDVRGQPRTQPHPDIPTTSTNMPATGTVTVEGARVVGQTLTASISNVADADGLASSAYSYQWIRVDGGVETPIAGATLRFYQVKPSDEGKALKIRVTFTDDAGFVEALESTEVEVAITGVLQSLVSNFEERTDGTHPIGLIADDVGIITQVFTTGSHRNGYDLVSVKVSFSNASRATAGETVSASLYYAQPGRNVAKLGNLAYALSDPAPFVDGGINEFRAPSGAVLLPDTVYHLAFTVNASSMGDFVLDLTESGGEQSQVGWAIEDFRRTHGVRLPSSGVIEEGAMKMSVEGELRDAPIPAAPRGPPGAALWSADMSVGFADIGGGGGTGFCRTGVLCGSSGGTSYGSLTDGEMSFEVGPSAAVYTIDTIRWGRDGVNVHLSFTPNLPSRRASDLVLVIDSHTFPFVNRGSGINAHDDYSFAGIPPTLSDIASVTELSVAIVRDPRYREAAPDRALSMSLVSNLSQDSSFDASVGDVRVPSRYTQKFTTGRHANGYDLTSVAVRIFEAQASGGESVTAYLYTATDSGAQGERLYTLATPSPLEPFSRVNEFAAPSGAVLYPNTVYFLSFTGTGDSRDDVRIALTSSDAEDAGGEADWAIEDEYRFNGQLVGALGGDYAIMMGVRGSARRAPLPNYPATGRVEVTGGKGAGRTLTAMVHDAADLADGLGSPVYAYQWFQVSGGVDSPIAGATEMTYRLESADVGKQVRAVASFEDAGGNAETLSSVAYPPGGQVRANGNADLASLSIDGVEELYVTKDGSLYVPLSGITSATERVTLRFSLARADAVCEVRYSQNDLQNNAALSQAAVLLEEDACPGEQTLDVTLAPGHNYVAVFVAAAAGNLKRFIVALYREEEPDYTLLEEGATRQGVRYSFPEASPDATIRIVLSGDATVEEDYVLYSLEGSAATLLTGPDYTVSVLPGGYVDLAAQAVDDAVVEGDEVFMVTLRWDGPTQPLQGSGVGGRSTSTDYVIVDNDAPATGAPLIAGAAQLGRTLQADLGGIVDLDGLPDSASSYAYQWIRVDGSAENPIAGETGNTYTVVSVDEGKMLKVRVEFTDLRGHSETLTSAATVTVLGAPPACPDLAHWCAALEVGHAEPQAGLDLFGYSGRQSIGRDDLPSVRRGALSVSVIAYEGVTYRVLGLNLHVRPGGMQFVAQFDTFLPTGTVIRVGDLGFLTDEALGRDGRGLYIWDTPGFSWMDSQQVTVSATFVSPATGTPIIRGRAQVGLTLMADTSGIADANGLGNVSYSYQWSRVDGDGETPIAGETGRTYEPVADDVGKALKVAVSFQDDLGYDEAAASAATAMVMTMADSLVSNFGETQTGSLNLHTGGFTQSFTTGSHSSGYNLASVRINLTVAHTDATSILKLHINAGNTRIYTLTAPTRLRQGVNEFTAPAGATLSAERDYRVIFQVSGMTQQSVEYAASITSSDQDVGETGWSIGDALRRNGNPFGTNAIRIAVLGQPRSSVPATGTVTVEGAPEMGQPLTVSLSGVADADGLTAPVYSYQWFQVSEGGASVIPGAVGAIFVPGAAELGRQLLVRVAFEDDMGFAEALESALTPPVALTPSPRLVSNTGQSTSNSSVRALHPPRETPQLTQSFTTGDHADGYVLSSVGIRLADVPQPSVADLLHFHIYTATPSGGLGERAHTLVSPAMLSADSVNHFAAPANAVLHAGVDYLLAFTFESNLSIADAPDLIRSNSDGEDIGGAPGWRIEDTYREQGRRVGAGRPWMIEVRGVARSPGFPGNSPATGAPTIPGIPSVSQSLVVDTGGISDRDGLAGVSYAYQWIRVDGSVEMAIPGETGSTYTVVSGDEGKGLRVRVTFTDDAGGAEARTSAATVAVVAAQEEQVLVSNTGFGGAGFAGLTSFEGPPDYSQLFTTGGNARGYELSSVGVAFGSVSNNSRKTFTLHIYTTTASKAIDQLVYTLETPAPLRPDRVNDFAAPPGTVLSANTEYALAASVVNSTSDFFLSLVSENGEDHALPGWSIEDADRFRGGVSSVQSWRISVRGQARSNLPATGAPWISGTVQEGQGLTVQTGDIRDGNGVGRAVYSYQWLWVSGDAEIEIPGATGNTYIPTFSDAGKLLRVRVTFADDEGNEEELVSAVTRPVAAQERLLFSNLRFLTDDIRHIAAGNISDPTAFTQAFTTGDHAHGYELSSVTVRVWNASLEPGETITLHIYTTTVIDDRTTAIDQLVYTLETPVPLHPGLLVDGSFELCTPDICLVDSDISFAAPPNAVLSANTKYALAITSVGDASGDFALTTTGQSFETGWNLDGPFRVGGVFNSPNDLRLRMIIRGRERDQARLNRPAIGAPQIAGRVQVGHTLTAIKGSIEDPDGLSNVNYTYQWIRLVAAADRFFEIPGATGRTYVPVLADEGKALAVRVSFTDDKGYAEEKMSVRSVPVVSVPTLVGNIGQVISFDARVGNVRAPTQYTQRFTTGSDADGYDLFSVGLRLFDFNGSAGETMVISLYEANNDGSLGAFQYSLRSPKRLVAAHHTVNEFLAPEGATLKRNTDYLLSFTGTGNSPHDVAIQLTSSEDQDTGGETDWEIEDEYRFNGQLVSDFPRADPHVIMMRVRGQPRSEPRPSIPHNTPASGAVTVKGGQRVGTRVTASVDAITDDNGMDGATYAYQWFLVDGEVEAEIPGATEQVYLLGSAEEGRQVRVRLSFQDDDGYAENSVSAVYPSGRPVRQSVDARLGSLSIDGVEELYVTKDGSLYVPLSGITSATESVMLRFTLSQADASCQVKYSQDDLQGSAALGQATELLGSAACTGTGQQVVDVPLGPGHNYVAVLVRSAAGNQKRFIVALYREAEADYTLLEEGETRQGVRYSFPEASTGAPIRIVLSGDATVEEDYVLYRLEGSVATRLTGPDYTVSVLAGGFVDLAAKAVDDAVEEGKEVFMVTLRWDGPAQPLQGSGVGGRSTSTDYAITDNDVYVATGAPVITGLPQVGQTLMVGTSGIVDLDGLAGVSYAYQWIRVDGGTETDILQNSSIESASGTGIRVDGSTETDIPGATGPTYVLVAADEGKTLKVRVSFTDDKGYVEVLTSAEASVVLADVGVLAITGGAQVGQTLTADTSGIVDRDGVTGVAYTYQWFQVDGGVEAEISGATSATYTVVPADEGKKLKVEASFTDNASNVETRTSAETPVVLPASADMRLVSNTGQAVLPLSVVAANRDTSGDVAQLFTTGRHANGYDFAGIGIRLGEIGAHAGETLTFQLHEATAGGGVGNLRYILTTPATLVANQVNDFAASATANLHAETSYVLAFTGTGDSLGDFELSLTTSDAEDSTSAADWSVADSYLYQGNSVSSGDALMMELRGTARNTPIPPNIPATGAPVITGAVRVGFALTAGPGSITDGNGTTDTVYAYQWIRVDGGTETEIPGATGSTYILVAADEGKTLKVRASFTDDAGYFEMSTSGATVAVLSTDAPEVLVGNIVGLDIVGTPAGFNLGLSTDSSVGAGGERSQGFHTGRHANGYNLSSVAVNFHQLRLEPGESVTFHIYTPAPSGAAGDLVYTLMPPAVSADGVNEYAAPANAVLYADTDYRLASTATNPISTNRIGIRSINLNLEFPAEKVAEGWRLDNSHRNADGGLNSLDTTYQMRVYGAPRSSPIPNMPATGAAVITGLVQVDQTLRVSRGSIRDLDGLANASYSYQWIRVDGGVETEIPEATGNTYVPVTAGVGAQLKVKVSFQDDRGYDEERESAATVPVALPPPLVSNLGQSTTSASLIGNNSTPAVTQAFTTGNHVNGYDLNFVRVSLNTGSVVLPGTSVTFYIYSATNVGGRLGDLLYTLTTPAVLMPPLSTNTQGVYAFEAPAGATLSAETKYLLTVTATGQASNEISIDVTNSGSEDSGHAVGWNIENTAYFNERSTGGLSLQIGVHGETRNQPIPANIPATGTLAIKGTPQVGQTLTANTNAIMDVDGLVNARYKYQWFQVDNGTETAISGATGNTYVVMASDVDKALKVAVSFRDDLSHDEVLTSAAVAVAVVLVSNTGQSSYSDRLHLGLKSDPREVTQQFTTGSNPNGYDLSAVALLVGATQSVTKSITFYIYSAEESDGSAGDRLYTLTTPARLDVTLENIFKAPAGATLAADTKYLLAVTSTGTSEFNFGFLQTEEDDEDASSAEGWSIENSYRRNGATVSSGISMKMQVTGKARSQAILANIPATGKPVIRGTREVAFTLRTDTSGIADADGLVHASYGYQWIRVDLGTETAIAGATGNTYVVTTADEGKALKVKVSFRDDLGHDEERASAAVVIPAPILVSNIGTSVGVVTINSNPEQRAQQFTTGRRANGYDLVSVEAHLGAVSRTAGEVLTLYIYTATDTGGPGFLLYTLTTPERLTANTVHYFTAPANAVLLANTRYLVGFGSTGSSINDFTFRVTNATTENNSSAAGWSIADSYHLEGQLAPLGVPALIRVRGYPRSQPAADNSPATGAPVITGLPQVRQTLTADTSAIVDANGLASVSYMYQWTRVDSGIETPIAGATGNTYVVMAADEGQELKVKVSFRDDQGYDEERASAPVAVAVTAPALVSNLGQQAHAVTHTVGLISDPLVVGQQFTTGDNTHGYDLSAVEARLTRIVDRNEDITFYIYTATAAGGPNDLLYTLTTPAELIANSVNYFAAPAGATLSADTKYLLSVTTTTTFEFSLVNSGTEDSGGANEWSIENRYRVRGSPSGQGPIAMNVTGRARSQPIPANSPATGAPVITGTTQVGRTLTADTSAIVDADGLVHVNYGYQWIRGDGGSETAIPGATGSTYAAVAADEGEELKVEVSFRDDLGHDEERVSAAVTVTAPDPVLVSNLGQQQSSSLITLGALGHPQAFSQPFTTGDNTHGYDLSVVEVNIRAINTQGGTFPGSVVTFYIYTTANNGSLGDLLYTLRTPAMLTVGVNVFEAPTGATLSAGTDYLLAATSTVSALAIVAVATNSDAEDSGGATGWSIGDTHRRDGQASSQDISLAMSMRGRERSQPIPANSPATGTPMITGTAQAGQTLTVDTGAIRDADGLVNASYEYQWIQVDGTTETEIQTGDTYVVMAADEGKELRVEVSFRDDLGHDEERISSVVVVAVPVPYLASNIGQALTGGHLGTDADPGRTTQRFTTGGNTQGYDLSFVRVNLRAINASPGETVTFHIYSAESDDSLGDLLYTLTTPVTLAAGVNVFEAPAGAVLSANTRYLLAVVSTGDSSSDFGIAGTLSDAEDVGGAVGWRIEDAYRQDGQLAASGVSMSMSVSGRERTGPTPPPNTPATGAPAITTGTPRVGQALTVATGAIRDADGLANASYTYQWIRVDSNTETNIQGATDMTYVPVAPDVGKTLKVRVSFRDDAGNSEALVSAETQAVTDIPAGVMVSESSLTVMEGESGTYVVKLLSAPTGTVTVAVSSSRPDVKVRPMDPLPADPLAEDPPLLLTFTSSNLLRTVTVNVTDDPHVELDVKATLTHEVSGANYGAHGVTAEPVTVTVPGFEVSADGTSLRMLVPSNRIIEVSENVAPPALEGVTEMRIELPAGVPVGLAGRDGDRLADSAGE